MRKHDDSKQRKPIKWTCHKINAFIKQTMRD